MQMQDAAEKSIFPFLYNNISFFLYAGPERKATGDSEGVIYKGGTVMKKHRIIIIVITAIILTATTYWSFSFASESRETAQKSEQQAVDNQAETKPPAAGNLRRSEAEAESADSYITSLFFTDNLAIGDTKAKLLDTAGEPGEQGMYEGGYFFAYEKATYFVNPDTGRISAIAVSGDIVDADAEQWAEAEAMLSDDLVLAGFNEMDGLWMEIYNWNEFDIMIERVSEDAAPFYIWLTEDKLFTN
ncbi:hypothetical protein SAMN05421736_103309 [Evansella caseinilytica]|uniref:Uncharacterized protein n=1 Tax=Evansella caseinilytica TaxID=1503961 RepID=A0A1H3MR67_9BACI|nr:hypothetical protein SAMN05421736_103309 [Evansella caseinilytica]